jgi:putative ABC transport system permease protein
LERFIYIINISIEAVFANKFRSILTALGIIFGVAAVISMLAIGNGARQEILEQMKLVGVNNIVIIPQSEIEKQKEQDEKENKYQQRYSPGLTLSDARGIADIVPTVLHVSPEVTYDTYILKDGHRTSAKLTGVTPEFFTVYNLMLEEGNMFNEQQLREGKAVCIIGPSIRSKFFSREDPLGQYIKCGNIWLKIIGILQNIRVSEGTSENLGITDYNNNIYAPIQTVLLRYRDRSIISPVNGQSGVIIAGNDVISFSSDGQPVSTETNQLDKIVVQVKESEQLTATAKVLNNMLKRRHSGVGDFEIKIPELLLRQQQRTKDIFNIVLGAIAGISLIVGGIGIMNIMLASVMERIKEIGIRMAAGATRRDITLQFLLEATMISITGGIIGIILGMTMAKIITSLSGILTIVSPASIFISFGVSVAVGILFGYMPAKKAAGQDPVESLRYE